MAEVFEVKRIKPQRMNIDAIRQEMLNELRKEGREVKKLYERTTATWRNKPEFEILIGLTRTSGEASVLVGTSNEIYGYVDLGTRPHTIRARNAPRLGPFRENYSAKTRPGKLASYPSGSWGRLRAPRVVRHPGTKPRKFTETIQKIRRRPFQRRMIRALQRGSKKLYR